MCVLSKSKTNRFRACVLDNDRETEKKEYPMRYVMLALAVTLAGSTAWAQSSGEDDTTGESDTTLISPLELDADRRYIQAVPAFFKFQAQVKQAGLPIEEATLNGLLVRLYDSPTLGTQLCTETIRPGGMPQIQISNDGLLNVEIGHAMACEGSLPFDQLIARSEELFLELVLVTLNPDGEQQRNALAPRIRLASVPFAVKANFCAQADDSLFSQWSAQAVYAHRALAGDNLTEGTASGFFEFRSPLGHEGEGFMRWAPVCSDGVCTDARDMTIASMDAETNDTFPLETLTLNSLSTNVQGDLLVTGNTTFGGTGSRMDVHSAVQFHGPVNLNVPITIESGNTLDCTDCVTEQTLAPSSVTTDSVTDGSLIGADIADNSLTARQLAPNSVGNSELSSNAVRGSNVVNGSLTHYDLAPNSVRGDEIEDGVVERRHLSGFRLSWHEVRVEGVFGWSGSDCEAIPDDDVLFCVPSMIQFHVAEPDTPYTNHTHHGATRFNRCRVKHDVSEQEWYLCGRSFGANSVANCHFFCAHLN
jgi:hypothetical protein